MPELPEPSGHRLLDLEAVRERLFPMLLPPRRVENLGEGQMVARLLATDLAVVYVEDTGPNQVRYITWSDLQHWGIGEAGLHQIALWNLERISEPVFPIVMNPPDRRDPMYVWSVQDGYDAARLLLHRWLAEVAPELDGQPLIAVPDRHWLAVTGAGDARKRAAVARLTRERYQRAAFPVSPLVYLWQGDRLEPLRVDPD